MCGFHRRGAFCGLSTSATVITKCLAALCRLNNIHIRKQEMIQTALKTGNNYVSVSCVKLNQSCEVYCKIHHMLYVNMQNDSYELTPCHSDMKLSIPYCNIFIRSGMDICRAVTIQKTMQSLYRKALIKTTTLTHQKVTSLSSELKQSSMQWKCLVKAIILETSKVIKRLRRSIKEYVTP